MFFVCFSFFAGLIAKLSPQENKSPSPMESREGLSNTKNILLQTSDEILRTPKSYKFELLKVVYKYEHKDYIARIIFIWEGKIAFNLGFITRDDAPWSETWKIRALLEIFGAEGINNLQNIKASIDVFHAGPWRENPGP